MDTKFNLELIYNLIFFCFDNQGTLDTTMNYQKKLHCPKEQQQVRLVSGEVEWNFS